MAPPQARAPGRRAPSLPAAGRTSTRVTDVHGFTAIELLVVIAIIGVVAGLLLPAGQAAREAARRIECSHHMKQLGLAVANYESIGGCLPPGCYPRASPAGTADFSVFVRLLPLLEQQAAYDATNLNLTSDAPENWTTGGFGLGTLRCPSDSAISSPQAVYAWRDAGIVPIGMVWGSSYSAVAGPWEWDAFRLAPGTLDRLLPGEARRIAQLGLIYPLSNVRPAEIVDGASHTLLFGEIDFTANRTRWTRGDGMNTLVSTCAPPNAKMLVDPPFSLLGIRSLHPGGVNCAFADGSVRFLKDSIDSWPFDPAVEGSPSLGFDPSRQVPTILPAAKVGVWQALSTRGDGDVVAVEVF